MRTEYVATAGRTVKVTGLATTALLVAATMFLPLVKPANAGSPGYTCDSDDMAYCNAWCLIGGQTLNTCYYNQDGVRQCICNGGC